jgi:peptide chain release factor 1
VLADQNAIASWRWVCAAQPLALAWRKWTQAQASMDGRARCCASDPELRVMAEEELRRSESGASRWSRVSSCCSPGTHDDNNIFLEVRAGTGGDEAAIFAGDLFRMYQKYAESRGWPVEIMSHSLGEHGGYKEIIVRIAGQGAYSRFKFESGTHRVQRVPATESQGRIHTSACTVAILPEAEDVEEVDLNPADLRIDTYRASSAGVCQQNGPAIRITPCIVEVRMTLAAQNWRAFRPAAGAPAGQEQARQASRRRVAPAAVGSGDRSQRIRTYNFPQGRVTDHRINLTLYKLDQVLAGNLDMLIDPLQQEHQAEMLAEVAG